MTLHHSESELYTIQRCPHDSENPYSMISNSILRHKELSMEAIWLLAYLLSNERNWTIRVKQVIDHLKGRAGRQKIYGLFDELIKFGYMKRERVRRGNLNNGCRYFISEKPKFLEENSKNSSDVPVSSTPKTGTIKNKQDSLRESKKQQQAAKPTKVATAPVVVFSKDQEKKEMEADLAAKQYIKAELSRGNVVNEKRILAKALKEGWKPNEDDTKHDLLASFKHGKTYRGINGNYFECYKDSKGIAFHNLNYPSSQPQGCNFGSSNFIDEFKLILNKLQIGKNDDNGI